MAVPAGYQGRVAVSPFHGRSRMSFCTVINCMDGRVQLPVIQYLQQRFGVAYVDAVTAAGPNVELAERPDARVARALLRRLDISVERHGSVGVAVVGHHDCAGNPTPREVQEDHLRRAVALVREHAGDLPVIGLWVDEQWRVHEVVPAGEAGA